MEFFVQVRAPAKLNLHLEVFGQRPDGFHELSSLFQAVDLCDDISVRSLKKSKSIEVTGDFDCPPEKTTVFRAAELFLREAGLSLGLSIHVRKGIPAGAGLGGGSSDAASLLRVLNIVTDSALSPPRLLEIAAAIGSDVPFFLGGRTSAIVEGRGEVLVPIAPRGDYAAVVAFPGFSVNTAWAYRQLDAKAAQADRSGALSRESMVALYEGPLSGWNFTNSFQPVVDSLHPPIAAIRAELLRSGACFSAMSGSGSSVFGVFPAMKAAQAAAGALAGSIAGMIGNDADPRRAMVIACRPLVSMHDLAYH